MSDLPQPLLSADALNTLTEVLLEKETLRRNLDISNFGDRVTDMDEGQPLFERIIRVTHGLLNLGSIQLLNPELVIARKLSHLPRQTATLYAMAGHEAGVPHGRRFDLPLPRFAANHR